MIMVRCARCGEELTEAGALLFGPPRTKRTKDWTLDMTTKRHLCGDCFRAVVGFIRRDGTP